MDLDQMLKTNLFLVLGLGILPILPAYADKPVEFGVSSGKFVKLYGGPVTTDLFVGCDFTVDAINTGTDWPSSVAIVYSTSENGDDDNEELVKLEAAKAADGNGWRYFFTIVETGERYTQVVLLPRRSSSIERLSLARLIEGGFVFLVGDDQDNTSVADISRLAMTSWSVIASGVTGSAFCSNEPTSMPVP